MGPEKSPKDAAKIQGRSLPREPMYSAGKANMDNIIMDKIMDKNQESASG